MTLDEFRKLEAAATPGPWTYTDDKMYGSVDGPPDENGYTTICDNLDFYPSPVAPENMAFIAACREFVPKLLAVVDAAPRGCICHVRQYDGYMGGTKHTEKCRRYTEALAAVDDPATTC